eukprot:jgi/Mesen1/2462/ME000158S01664
MCLRLYGLSGWRRARGGGGHQKWVIANLGDSLWSLADAHSITVADLQAANGLSKGCTQLHVGQEVLIPLPRQKPLQLGPAALRLLAHPLRRLGLDPDPLPLQFLMQPEVLSRVPVLRHPALLRLLPHWKAEPFGLPVRGGWLSSYYGWKDGRWYFHNGIDIAVEEGTPVEASTSGRVTFAGPKGGYGNTVCVDHGNAHWTLYAHCSDVLVRPGQFVRKGATLALSGNTGFSTGPHLHFEIHQGPSTIDPLTVLPAIC